jgi:cysteinyl-tRNA synthetase
VSDLLKRHGPDTLRFFLLATHYRSPIDYSEDRLEEVRRGLDGFHRFFERFGRVSGGSYYDLPAPATRAAFDTGGSAFLAEVARHREAFLECMDDDFNTGGAVGALYELLNALNRHAEIQRLDAGGASPEVVAEYRRAASVLRELSQILGVFREPPAEPAAGKDQLAAGLMQLLIDLRAEARKAKNFALADQIRQRLGALGVTLEDRPGGTGWRLG